jgi:hypothetical protein
MRESHHAFKSLHVPVTECGINRLTVPHWQASTVDDQHYACDFTALSDYSDSEFWLFISS